MDQQKIGISLKQLRVKKHVTQQQLAEILGVSNRTVSRWETGRNMPDFDLLLELAKYYDVGVDAILNGSPIPDRSENAAGDTMYAVAEYTGNEKNVLQKKYHVLCWIGALGILCFLLFDGMGLSEKFPYDAIGGFGLGIALGMLICGILHTGKYGKQIRAAKKKVIAKLRRKSNI